MTKRNIKSICIAFSKDILEFSNGESANMCFMVCSPLDGYLGFLGIESKLVEGLVGKSKLHHYWIEIGDSIFDPTADQFTDIPLPRYYWGKLPSHYKKLPCKSHSTQTSNQITR